MKMRWIRQMKIFFIYPSDYLIQSNLLNYNGGSLGGKLAKPYKHLLPLHWSSSSWNHLPCPLVVRGTLFSSSSCPLHEGPLPQKILLHQQKKLERNQLILKSLMAKQLKVNISRMALQDRETRDEAIVVMDLAKSDAMELKSALDIIDGSASLLYMSL